MRAGPQVGAALDLAVAPAAERLQPVVAAAQRRDVARAGRTGVRMAWVVGRDVVAVGVVLVGPAPAGGSGAEREDAGLVDQDRRLGHPVRDLVLAVVDVVGQVDDGLHHHLGAGLAAPEADLLGGDQGAGVLQPAEVTELAVGDRVLRKVGVEHHPPRLSPCRRLLAASGELRVCWLRASSPTAAARRTSNESVDPRALSCSAPAATAESRSSASATSSSPDTWAVPFSEVSRVSMSKCRPSAAALRRASASAGMNRLMASSTSRSSW